MESTSESKPAKPAADAFRKLFTAGVAGWAVGVLVLFALSWVIARPVSLSAAIVWTISHSWAAFLFGGLVLVGYGLKSGFSIGGAAVAYLLPVGVLVAIAGVCLLVYPDYSMREELLTYLPIVLTFYALSLLWIWARRGVEASDSFARAVIPSLLGGVVVLGFVTVPVFASDAFRYRNTFELKISKAEMQNGKLVVEGTLEIREPGNFTFTAPRYVWSPEGDESETEAGEISWGEGGVPKSGSPGVFPIRIVWSKALAADGVSNYGMYEDSINIQVHRPDEGNKVVYFLSAPMYDEP